MSIAIQSPAPSISTSRAPRRGHAFLALVRQGLRDNRRTPLTWGGSLGAMTAMMTALWPSIEKSAAKLVDSYPAGIKEAFGISQLDSVEAYVDAEMLSLMIPLALAFFAVRCATRATVGAEDRGHLNTLLALPLSRRTLVGASFAVTGVVLAQILAVVWTLTWITGTVVGTGISASALAAGLVNVWPLAMLFAGLAVLAAGVVHRPATVTAIAAGAAAATYVLDLAGKLAGAVEPLRALSPFRYYGSAIQHGLDASHVVGLTFVAVALAAAGAQLFERRDVL
ncbi:MAG TPA: ABC transporter permease subunit [Solirubrobacteraceae bacterium]|jgi:ABC-2 type transport system permease protein|nr:ABC transporter permease subunit [Solirubrobacteraceae bacterium]